MFADTGRRFRHSAGRPARVRPGACAWPRRCRARRGPASAKMPMGKPKARHRGIDLVGQGAVLEHVIGLRAGRRDMMRLPMKPSQTRAGTAILRRLLPKREAGCQHVGRGVSLTITSSSSFITWAGEKKCSPSTRDGSALARRSRRCRDRRCWRPERRQVASRVKLGEDRLLHVHVLEHGLDDQIGIGERG
jgi:hypothetical protein